MKQTSKTIALWFVVILMIISVFHFMNQPVGPVEEINFSEFLSAAQEGQVEKVSIQDETYSGKFKTGHKEGALFHTVGPSGSEMVYSTLAKSDAQVEYKRKDETPFWQHLLISWLPMIILFGFFFFSMRQIQMGGGRAMSFGRSKAKLLNENQRRMTFKDVAGVDEAKQELEEIIAFLKDPKKFTKLGGRIPKGVLLMGSPGTGKTLLARAVAGEAGVPFFSISGSDFVEMFVGVGASRVRDLFEQGKKNAPCIVFIDEIDAVGRHRGAGLGGGHDEREQTLNQLLVEMDGFESNEGVIIMAATNRPDVLDPALMRPGRFDRRVIVPRPDVRGREEILLVHGRKTKLSNDVDMSVIARGTPGFSGADLESIVNEAALLAARYNKEWIEMVDLEQAKDKVMMGSERKSLIMSDDEKKNTAYHEAGHTLVAKLIPGTDPIHKVTIVPRGMALGLTQQLPVDDRYTQNREFCEKSLAILMGGRAAEELIFSQPTTGAGNDIERATELARKMVCEWGMSEAMGPLSFGRREEPVFLGREFGRHQDYSEETAKQIDSEIRRMVTTSYDWAKKLLKENLAVLHALAEALLEYETLNLEQINFIAKGGKLPPLPKSPMMTPPAVVASEVKAKPVRQPKAFLTPKPEPSKA